LPGGYFDSAFAAWQHLWSSARDRSGSVLFEGPYLEDQQLWDVLEVAQAVEGDGTVEYQPGCASALVD
jgi:hypothetical protein